MTHLRKLTGTLTLVAVVAGLLTLGANRADATIFGRNLDRAPAKSAPVTKASVAVQPGAVHTVPSVPVYESPACAPCISYCHHRTLRKTCCGCCDTLKILLPVQDPCCCTNIVEVPVCLPGCCTDAPCVSSRCGLFGRGIVTYTWCCGYKVRVVFNKCGDVVVHSYGR